MLAGEASIVPSRSPRRGKGGGGGGGGGGGLRLVSELHLAFTEVTATFTASESQYTVAHAVRVIVFSPEV